MLVAPALLLRSSDNMWRVVLRSSTGSKCNGRARAAGVGGRAHLSAAGRPIFFSPIAEVCGTQRQVPQQQPVLKHSTAVVDM